METAPKKTILRIEFWHAIMLFTLVATLGRSKFIDSTAVMIGGVFMGVNFFLLSLGIAWVLTPLAGKGRVRAGVGLLVLKMLVFLGLLSALFFRFEVDAFSFALGFSTLILGIVIEATCGTVAWGRK